MDKKKLQIFIATHKKFINRTNSPYIPLYVGKSNKNDLKYLGDDTGDNISSKNAYYCELTGLYWIMLERMLINEHTSNRRSGLYWEPYLC